MGEGLEFGFWILALVGTTAFVFKLAMLLFGFGEHGGDMDMDMDMDAGDFDGDGHVGHGAESTAAFAFLSFQSISTFFMGAGWMGLVAMKSWGLDRVQSTLLAIGFGIFLVILLGKLLQQAMRLESSGTLDVRQAIGKTAKVYSRIAAGGRGQVQVEVQGRLATLDATTHGDELATGQSVRVDEVDGAGVLVVSAAR